MLSRPGQPKHPSGPYHHPPSGKRADSARNRDPAGIDKLLKRLVAAGVALTLLTLVAFVVCRGPRAQDPEILVHPSSETAVDGTDAEFRVEAAGTLPVSFQWRHSGADLAGCTRSVLHLDQVSAKDAGVYDVVVKNGAGSTKSALVALTVLPRRDLPGAPVRTTGRLEGVLSDRSGRAISSMVVAVRSGPETSTDSFGSFVLNEVPAGDQLLEVRAPSDRGRKWTQHIRVSPEGTTKVNIAYNATSSRLGLFYISAPTDGSLLDVTKAGRQFFAEVYGRCDGLDEILGPRFDVWVLIRSQLDLKLWVQHPPALVALSEGTWKANIQLGGAETPPQNGEKWELVAVAAPAASDMKRILNVTSLSDLPEHIRANFVTIESRIR